MPTLAPVERPFQPVAVLPDEDASVEDEVSPEFVGLGEGEEDSAEDPEEEVPVP